MIQFNDLIPGRFIELVKGDPIPSIRSYIKPIPAGVFKIVRVRPSAILLICSGTGKKEMDTTVEVVKVSKTGKQIGTYRYEYAAEFFMKNGVLKEFSPAP